MTGSARLAICAALLALACARAGGNGESAQPPAAFAPAQSVTLRDGKTIAIEVVADPETRAQGLMFRSSLSADRGMLFIFPESDAHSFWMKNTLIPLDIIWIDEARTVVHVERDVPPCKADPCASYPPGKAAKYVLELAAGQAAARGVREGDRVTIEGIENIVAR